MVFGFTSLSTPVYVGYCLNNGHACIQVWSNGKVKKVRGIPTPLSSSSSSSSESSSFITISLLITLPLDKAVTVFPQLLFTSNNQDKSVLVNEKLNNEGIHLKDGDGDDDEEERLIEEKLVFSSFPFEEYAWRVYHERLSLKDPLARYRLC